MCCGIVDCTSVTVASTAVHGSGVSTLHGMLAEHRAGSAADVRLCQLCLHGFSCGTSQITCATVVHTDAIEFRVSSALGMRGSHAECVRGEWRRGVPTIAAGIPMLLQMVAPTLAMMLTPLRGHTDQVSLQETGGESFCVCGGAVAHSAAEQPLRSSPFASRIRSKLNGMAKQCI